MKSIFIILGAISTIALAVALPPTVEKAPVEGLRPKPAPVCPVDGDCCCGPDCDCCGCCPGRGPKFQPHATPFVLYEDVLLVEEVVTTTERRFVSRRPSLFNKEKPTDAAGPGPSK